MFRGGRLPDGRPTPGEPQPGSRLVALSNRSPPLDTVTLVGSLAALCSTTSFAPQAWKVIRTRDTSAISKRMYALTVVGFALWLAYGAWKGEWPIIVPNAICLALAAFILAMKLLPRRQKEAVAAALDPTADRA